MKVRIRLSLLTLFQLYWLVVFIPSHQRGAITFDGVWEAGEAVEVGRGCCGGEHEPGPAEPTEGDRSQCVVCYFVAGLSTPPPVLVVPELSRSLIFGAMRLAEGVRTAATAVPYDATGPPGF